MPETQIKAALIRFTDAIKTSDGTALSAALSEVDSLLTMHREALHPQLRHFLEGRSYAKALAWLGERATPGEFDAGRLLVLRAAYEKDRGAARLPAEAAMAKMFATEAAQRIIDKAVQLHGGLGVTLGSEVERLYREIRPLRIYEGTTEIQRVIIARQLLQNRGHSPAS